MVTSTPVPALASTVAAYDNLDLDNILVTSTPDPALALPVAAYGLDLDNILVASTPNPILASTVAAHDDPDLQNVLVTSTPDPALASTVPAHGLDLDKSVGVRKLPRGPHPELWRKNIRKNLKAKGLSYTDANGHVRACRKMKPNPCSGKKYQNKCGILWPEETRLELFQMYGSLGHHQQRDFIVNHTRKVEIKTRRTVWHKLGAHTKTISLKFYLPGDSSDMIPVCKQFFLQTLDIRPRLVEYSIHNAVNGFAKQDSRGNHRAHNKTRDCVTETVRCFIRSLPAMPSHYCRASTNRLYLPSSLQNLKRLYLGYKLHMQQQTAGNSQLNTSVASQNVFESVFRNEFNIGFHGPKKDKCS